MTARSQPLTSRQLKALSASETDRVVKSDMAGVLQSVDRREWPRLRRLSQASLTTRPYSTEFTGLCRRDLVVVRYSLGKTAAAAEDQPLRPYGVEARAQFHAVSTPVTPAPQPSPGATLAGAPCPGLAADGRVAWFEAASTKDAALSVNLLEAALGRVRNGTLVPAPCNFGSRQGPCDKSAVKDANSADIASIEGCDAAPGQSCFKYYLKGIVATVVARKTGDGSSPEAVSTIALGSYVVVD